MNAWGDSSAETRVAFCLGVGANPETWGALAGQATCRGAERRHSGRPILDLMPELPEVELTARRLSAALVGAEVESVLAPGMVALKTVDPPLDPLVGRKLDGVRRIGKMLLVDAAGGAPTWLVTPARREPAAADQPVRGTESTMSDRS